MPHQTEIVNGHTTPQSRPMEVSMMTKVKGIKGVIQVLDVFVTLDDVDNITGYVFLMEQPPPPVRNLFKYTLDKRPIKGKRAIDIVRPVVGIITEVHKAVVFHQDLKHENILLEYDTGICPFD